MIIVLAGTTEGVQTARLLKDHGYTVLASALTLEGATSLQSAGIDRIVWGSQDESSLVELIQQQKSGWLVDATHPFAGQIRITAIKAARVSGIKHIRLERPAANLPVHPLIACINSLEQAETYIKPGMMVLSTLGSRHIVELAAITRRCGARLKARIMPFEDSLSKCLEAGLDAGDVIMSGGAVSTAENVQTFREHNAQLVIGKESGAIGGLPSKIDAALQLGIPILIWKRPDFLNYPDYPEDYPGSESPTPAEYRVVNSAAEVLQIIQKT